VSDVLFSLSPSGIRIAADFRDNLIIDRYDPVFVSMRAGKRLRIAAGDSPSRDSTARNSQSARR